MNKFRKLIALLLTVIMFVGVLPMNALAAVIVATDTSESKQISLRAIKPEPENPKVYYKTFVFHIGNNEVDRQIVKMTIRCMRRRTRRKMARSLSAGLRRRRAERSSRPSARRR